MPCVWDGPRESDRYPEVIDQLTRMLCETIKRVGESRLTPEVRRWWAEHQEADRRRRREEAADQRRGRTRAALLKRLTPAEREALAWPTYLGEVPER